MIFPGSKCQIYKAVMSDHGRGGRKGKNRGAGRGRSGGKPGGKQIALSFGSGKVEPGMGDEDVKVGIALHADDANALDLTCPMPHDVAAGEHSVVVTNENIDRGICKDTRGDMVDEAADMDSRSGGGAVDTTEGRHTEPGSSDEDGNSKSGLGDEDVKADMARSDGDAINADALVSECPVPQDSAAGTSVNFGSGTCADARGDLVDEAADMDSRSGSGAVKTKEGHQVCLESLLDLDDAGIDGVAVSPHQPQEMQVPQPAADIGERSKMVFLEDSIFDVADLHDCAFTFQSPTACDPSHAISEPMSLEQLPRLMHGPLEYNVPPEGGKVRAPFRQRGPDAPRSTALLSEQSSAFGNGSVLERAAYSTFMALPDKHRNVALGNACGEGSLSVGTTFSGSELGVDVIAAVANAASRTTGRPARGLVVAYACEIDDWKRDYFMSKPGGYRPEQLFKHALAMFKVFDSLRRVLFCFC